MEEYSNSRNVSRVSTDGLSNIRHAGLFARFVAVIVDLAIMGIVFFGLVLLTQNTVCVNSPYVKKAQEEYYGYNIDSGLYEKNETDGTYKERTFDNYLGYQDMFYSYYTDYLVNKCPEKYRVNYNGKDNYWFNVFVLGQNDDLKLYSDTDLNKRNELVRVTGAELFTYKLDAEEKPLYDEIALARCLKNNPEAEVSLDDRTKLIRYFYISDADNVNNETCYYHIATLDLVNRTFVSKVYDTWYNHYYSYPMIACLSLSMIIFFFVIPMIFKNGETLGKLIFHLGLVNKLGYRYNRLQLIPRFLFMMVIVVALYFIIGVSLWLLGILTFLALVSYGLAIFTHNHQAIHDFIAGTIVIDKIHSEIYQNATQEEKIKDEINSVKSLIPDVETPRDESVLYVNKNYGKDDNNKEG